MKISSLDKIQKVKATMEGAKEVYKQVPISKQEGSPNFSFRVFTIGPKVIPLITNILLSI